MSLHGRRPRSADTRTRFASSSRGGAGRRLAAGHDEARHAENRGSGASLDRVVHGLGERPAPIGACGDDNEAERVAAAQARNDPGELRAQDDVERHRLSAIVDERPSRAFLGRRNEPACTGYALYTDGVRVTLLGIDHVKRGRVSLRGYPERSRRSDLFSGRVPTPTAAAVTCPGRRHFSRVPASMRLEAQSGPMHERQARNRDRGGPAVVRGGETSVRRVSKSELDEGREHSIERENP